MSKSCNTPLIHPDLQENCNMEQRNTYTFQKQIENRCRAFVETKINESTHMDRAEIDTCTLNKE